MQPSIFIIGTTTNSNESKTYSWFSQRYSMKPSSTKLGIVSPGCCRAVTITTGLYFSFYPPFFCSLLALSTAFYLASFLLMFIMKQ